MENDAKPTSFGNPFSRTTTLTKFSSSSRVRLYNSVSSRSESRNASLVFSFSSGPCDGCANVAAEGVVGGWEDAGSEWHVLLPPLSCAVNWLECCISCSTDGGWDDLSNRCVVGSAGSDDGTRDRSELEGGGKCDAFWESSSWLLR